MQTEDLLPSCNKMTQPDLQVTLRKPKKETSCQAMKIKQLELNVDKSGVIIFGNKKTTLSL